MVFKISYGYCCVITGYSPLFSDVTGVEGEEARVKLLEQMKSYKPPSVGASFSFTILNVKDV